MKELQAARQEEVASSAGSLISDWIYGCLKSRPHFRQFGAGVDWKFELG
jgi:hypothetical protein